MERGAGRLRHKALLFVVFVMMMALELGGSEGEGEALVHELGHAGHLLRTVINVHRHIKPST